MAARSPLRLLAPIAIAVVLVGVVVVVVSSSSNGGSGDKGTARTATAPAKKKVPPRRRTYRVKEGDTLTAISDKTGVSTARLIALNPGLDPQTLQLGDRLKLRP
jgi:LysM repeat protein